MDGEETKEETKEEEVKNANTEPDKPKSEKDTSEPGPGSKTESSRRGDDRGGGSPEEPIKLKIGIDSGDKQPDGTGNTSTTSPAGNEGEVGKSETPKSGWRKWFSTGGLTTNF